MNRPPPALHVKICGFTRIDDVEAAVSAGADMIGLNFVSGSPRRIDVPLARALVGAARGRVEIVGVVADLDPARVAELVVEVGLDRVQLHGDEPPEVIDALGPRAFKALRIGGAEDVALAARYGGDLLLVDARVPGQQGGTGVRVDPALVVELARARRLLLAGGLGPDNVAEAVRVVRPWGVDVASGVESAPGLKDERKMRAFVSEARRAAQEAARTANGADEA
ncbi:phosphoribosylanthranilate isomerase [Polyangium mundeleinium]|uniref:N-(5'-phosphoribosyl)anthranilate isomerase n=1 Tax=Polyangium mundeleinium TaxID=2995306 RepID=A0ABT5EZJ9_9BACT|nr:phosphoribosylanthranilate isomerase [Polyangium mundeleinium]MDC0746814.1 phosphoribosylanthranilate isomerase [Polyangium mundeleinium]